MRMIDVLCVAVGGLVRKGLKSAEVGKRIDLGIEKGRLGATYPFALLRQALIARSGQVSKHGLDCVHGSIAECDHA